MKAGATKEDTGTGLNPAEAILKNEVLSYRKNIDHEHH